VIDEAASHLVDASRMAGCDEVMIIQCGSGCLQSYKRVEPQIMQGELFVAWQIDISGTKAPTQLCHLGSDIRRPYPRTILRSNACKSQFSAGKKRRLRQASKRLSFYIPSRRLLEDLKS